VTVRQYARLFGVRPGRMAFILQLAGYRFEFVPGGARPVECVK
jgi:hypothetical protein